MRNSDEINRRIDELMAENCAAMKKIFGSTEEQHQRLEVLCDASDPLAAMNSKEKEPGRGENTRSASCGLGMQRIFLRVW